MLRLPHPAQLRMSANYLACGFSIGVTMPYWPVWLKENGLTAEAVGFVIGSGILVRCVAGPAAGLVADRIGDRGFVTMVCAAIAAAAFLLFQWADGFSSFLLINMLYFSFFGCVMPMVEAQGARTAIDHNIDYGRMRVWGSGGFILGVMIGGRILEDFGVPAIFWLSFAGLGLIVAASAILPKERPMPVEPDKPVQGFSFQAAGRLVRHPLFLLFMLAASLAQANHSFYYAMGTVHWRSLGFSGDWISVLWTIGVVAEIILLWVYGRRLPHLGPAFWIMLGTGIAVLRWTINAFDPAPGLLLFAQILHGLTFGASHVGAIQFLARAVPRAYAATAQNVYGALGVGLFMGLTNFASGTLYEAMGARAYLVMALMSGAGFILAAILGRQWSGGTLDIESPVVAKTERGHA